MSKERPGKNVFLKERVRSGFSRPGPSHPVPPSTARERVGAKGTLPTTLGFRRICRRWPSQGRPVPIRAGVACVLRMVVLCALFPSGETLCEGLHAWRHLWARRVVYDESSRYRITGPHKSARGSAYMGYRTISRRPTGASRASPSAGSFRFPRRSAVVSGRPAPGSEPALAPPEHFRLAKAGWARTMVVLIGTGPERSPRRWLWQWTTRPCHLRKGWLQSPQSASLW